MRSIRLRQLVYAVCLAASLSWQGCEEGHPLSNPDPYWVTWMWAEWTAADSVEIRIQFAEFDGYRKEDIRTGEFTLYSGESKDGPWTKIDYQVWRSEDIDHDFVYTIRVAQPSALTFFYVESRFYIGGSLGVANAGPLIATTQPLMTNENWQALPDLTTTIPVGSSNMWSYSYQASALSPDGEFLFIQNDMNRVYELASGREVRRGSLARNRYEQGRSYWFDSSIYINAGYLTVIDPLTFAEKLKVSGWNTFLRGDSMFIMLQNTNWYTYNIRTQRLDSIPSEFPVPKNNARKATISQSPSGQYYGANDWDGSYFQWRLFDSRLTLFRSLSPVNKTGLHYRIDESLKYGFPLFLDMYWLSDDVVMMNTRWSGEEEIWCYRISTSTYYQITGRRMPPVAGGGDYKPFLARRMYVNPVFDRVRNRILFIYELNKSTHAVRAFQLPW